MFDVKPSLEAGHRLPRIFHTSDFTGQDIEKTLLKKIIEGKNIKIFKNSLSIDLIVKKKACQGVFILMEDDKVIPYFAKAVILATGGSGQVYQWTTNPTVATGDGIAMGHRIGVKIADTEFVQFHPTALKYDVSPLFLLSERLRGEGGWLVDNNNKRFVDELLPRDELARAVFEKQKTSEVYLSLAHLNKKEIVKKLPNICKRLKTYGYDLTVDRVPITPAAHYQCGGIVTDLNGKTSIKNLFAVGEVSATGAHGANRLASNSLLEAVVFGKQAGKHIAKNPKSKIQDPNNEIKNKKIKINFSQNNKDILNKIEVGVKKVMWEKVGIVRRKKDLILALNYLQSQKRLLDKMYDIKKIEKDGSIKIIGDVDMLRNFIKVNNLVEVGIVITQAAISRRKSLGAHYID